jgi:hypothetical protein
LVAARHHPVMREFYERLLAAGTAKKMALTAWMRKVLTMLNAMVQHRSRWQLRGAQSYIKTYQDLLTHKTVALYSTQRSYRKANGEGRHSR